MSDDNGDWNSENSDRDDDIVDLSFKVSRRFKRRYKTVANARDVSHKKLLEELLEFWIEQRGEFPSTRTTGISRKDKESETRRDPSGLPFGRAIPPSLCDNAVERSWSPSGSASGRRATIHSQLSSVIRECLALVGFKDGETFEPKAKGFFVSYDEGEHTFTYLVMLWREISELRRDGHGLWLVSGVFRPRL